MRFKVASLMFTRVGLGLGGPRPATRCRIVLDRNHCVDGARSAMVILRHIVAGVRVVKCLPTILMCSEAASPGPRRTGSTSRTSGGATGASSSVMYRPLNGGASTATTALASPAAVVTKLAALVTTCLPPLRPRAAQFVGGLTVLCSRLGR